eukprot:2113522-Lingulodinium_polyedra.AAC.1
MSFSSDAVRSRSCAKQGRSHWRVTPPMSMEPSVLFVFVSRPMPDGAKMRPHLFANNEPMIGAGRTMSDGR